MASGICVVAIFCQKDSNCSAASPGLPCNSPYQATAAHSAPPEVPESPTMRCCAGSSSRNSVCNTPPVNAVWLPPPWQAMAMVFGGVAGEDLAGRRVMAGLMRLESVEFAMILLGPTRASGVCGMEFFADAVGRIGLGVVQANGVAVNGAADMTISKVVSVFFTV